MIYSKKRPSNNDAGNVILYVNVFHSFSAVYLFIKTSIRCLIWATSADTLMKFCRVYVVPVLGLMLPITVSAPNPII